MTKDEVMLRVTESPTGEGFLLWNERHQLNVVVPASKHTRDEQHRLADELARRWNIVEQLESEGGP